MSYLDWEIDVTTRIKKKDLVVHFTKDLSWTADVAHKGVYKDTLSLGENGWEDDPFTDPVVKQFVEEKWAEYMSSLMLGESDGDVRGSGRYTVRNVDVRFKTDDLRSHARKLEMDVEDRDGDQERRVHGLRPGEEALAGASSGKDHN